MDQKGMQDKLTASYDFVWNIHNFCFPVNCENEDIEDHLGSKKFKILLGDNETNWTFEHKINFNGIDFLLIKDHSKSNNFSARVTCMIPRKDKDGKEASVYCEYFNTGCLQGYRSYGKSLRMSFESFQNDDLYDETFVLKMYIKVELFEENSPEEIIIQLVDAPPSSKYGELYFSGDFSDFTIVCADGPEYRVHRCILSVNSPVMKAMLQTQMQESIENEMKVNDIDGIVMHKILLFMYTEKIEEFSEHLEGLLYGSEKYQIPKLKGLCIDYMFKNIRAINVIKFFMLAQLYDIERLMQLCLMYIEIYHEDLVKTEEWEQLSAVQLDFIEKQVKDYKARVKAVKFQLNEYFWERDNDS